MIKKIFLILIVLIAVSEATAQKGKIRGTVYEEATADALVGVSVFIKGSTIGTTTDLDGKFTLELEPGTYTIQISYISFQTISLEGVIVADNQVTILDNLNLKEVTQDLAEVVIRAEASNRTEGAMLTMKKKSTAILDGISSAKMQLTGDATAIEAARRITGVTVEGGKYIYVRGLGDRYTKTQLNQVDIPGLDPDRNSLQMDIFPTSMINNITVSKNFLAEMPAEFTGGLVNIETKDFPEEKSIVLTFGITYAPSMHFNPNYITYKGGSTDFLGFDDGTRALPDRAKQPNIPTPISGASSQEVFDFTSSFDPQLATQAQTSGIDYDFSFSLGNQIDLKEKKSNRNPKLGYIFSLSYKSNTIFYDDVYYGEYQRYIDPDIYEMRYATIQQGSIGEKHSLVGALGGVAYKTTYSKYKFTAMILQNGVSRSGSLSIENDGAAVGQSGYQSDGDFLEYNQRTLANVLINGTHLTKSSGWEIDWRVSPTYSSSQDPDIRKTAFTYQPIDTLFSAGAAGNPSRIWRSLSEINATARIDFVKKYTFLKDDAKLKFGVNYNYKQRQYEILFFDIQFFGSQSWPNPDPVHVLDSINLYPNKPNSIYYQSGNNNPNPNEYSSNVNNLGGYVSTEFNIFPQLKTILGIRVENYTMRHTGRDQIYASGDYVNGKNLNNEVVLSSTDFFPSINFVYAINENQNLRASYSRTIARPTFKELSYAQILDPISNRIFNGSLFVYNGWDGKLIETRINNFDLRWEWFLERGQMFSVGGFYKTFDNPIELVRIPEQQTSTEYQPRNVGDGQLYGIELELRKDFSFISPFFSHFSINGNFTFVNSIIDMTETEYNSRKTYQKTGETIENTRVMAGQSPYVINAGFSYSSSELGLEAGIYYNVKGETLSIVGAGLFPDIYVGPFNSLNFNLNKTIGKERKAKIDFKISNLLNQKVESYYKSFNAENQVYNRFNPGLAFGIGIRYNF